MSGSRAVCLFLVLWLAFASPRPAMAQENDSPDDISQIMEKPPPAMPKPNTRWA